MINLASFNGIGGAAALARAAINALFGNNDVLAIARLDA